MALLFDSWCLDLSALVCGLVLLAYLYIRYVYTYWKRRGVPHLPPTFPLGNFADPTFNRCHIGETFQRIYASFPNERFVGVYMVNKPVLVICDVALVKQVTVKDFEYFSHRGVHINEDVDPLSAHFMLMEEKRWKKLRSKFTPLFTPRKVKMVFPLLLQIADSLKAHMKEPALLREVVEITDVMARYTTDAFSSCTFGIECNSLKDPDAEFRKYGNKFFNPNFYRGLALALSFGAPRLCRVLKITQATTDVKDFFTRIVKELTDFREKNKFERNDLMQLMIRLKDTGCVDTRVDADDSEPRPDVEKLTMKDMIANTFLFYMAGYQSSSVTISFCLYELAQHPSIQARLHKDIDSALKKHGALTYEAVQDMRYLDMVLSETLRKYPGIPVVFRECIKRYEMPDSNLVIEPESLVCIPILAIHRDPKYYPDPDVFDPERFSEEAKASRPPGCYLPFGEGPKNCIGMLYGIMQVKLGIIGVLSEMEVSVCDKTVTPLIMNGYSVVIAPKGGIFLRVAKRGGQ